MPPFGGPRLPHCHHLCVSVFLCCIRQGSLISSTLLAVLTGGAQCTSEKQMSVPKRRFRQGTQSGPRPGKMAGCSPSSNGRRGMGGGQAEAAALLGPHPTPRPCVPGRGGRERLGLLSLLGVCLPHGHDGGRNGLGPQLSGAWHQHRELRPPPLRVCGLAACGTGE